MDEERRFWEHQEYDVGRDIEWLRSGSWCVDEAEWYRQSFDGIDGKSNEGIPVGNGIFDGKDPDVDTTAELSMFLRKPSPGPHREAWEWDPKS